MAKRKELKELEEVLKSERIKAIKPNECGLIHDETRGYIYGICNKDGVLTVTKVKIPSRKKRQGG